MQNEDKNRMRHMLDAALEAQMFMKEVSREALPEDRKTTQAVIRSLEIIGEAASKISKDTKESHPKIPWSEITGMRNWLIHAYFDIDYNHIWNTVYQDLPSLISMLKDILQED